MADRSRYVYEFHVLGWYSSTHFILWNNRLYIQKGAGQRNMAVYIYYRRLLHPVSFERWFFNLLVLLVDSLVYLASNAVWKEKQTVEYNLD